MFYSFFFFSLCLLSLVHFLFRLLTIVSSCARPLLHIIVLILTCTWLFLFMFVWGYYHLQTATATYSWLFPLASGCSLPTIVPRPSLVPPYRSSPIEVPRLLLFLHCCSLPIAIPPLLFLACHCSLLLLFTFFKVPLAPLLLFFLSAYCYSPFVFPRIVLLPLLCLLQVVFGVTSKS